MLAKLIAFDIRSGPAKQALDQEKHTGRSRDSSKPIHDSGRDRDRPLSRGRSTIRRRSSEAPDT
jgi:hypothetical protein